MNGFNFTYFLCIIFAEISSKSIFVWNHNFCMDVSPKSNACLYNVGIGKHHQRNCTFKCSFGFILKCGWKAPNCLALGCYLVVCHLIERMKCFDILFFRLKLEVVVEWSMHSAMRLYSIYTWETVILLPHFFHYSWLSTQSWEEFLSMQSMFCSLLNLYRTQSESANKMSVL